MINNRYLFRGKRIDGFKKFWMTGHYVSAPRPMIVSVEPRIGGGWDTDDVDPYTVGQCTGLTDKNGTLIFEGDIVTRRAPIYKVGKKEPEGEYQAVGVVEICEDGKEAPNWVVKSHDHLGNKNDVILFVNNSGWHEGWYVIGNIHDNNADFGSRATANLDFSQTMKEH